MRGVAPKHPVTMAIRALRAAKVDFTPHLYPWEPHGGTRASAAALGVDEHLVIKTLIFEDDQRAPLCILMHGDREVSAKNLARQVGARSTTPCTPEVADKHSGYQVGGTSPFATRKAMPVYVEATILALDRICINGGRRGYLIGIAPRVLIDLLGARPVSCAI